MGQSTSKMLFRSKSIIRRSTCKARRRRRPAELEEAAAQAMVLSISLVSSDLF